MAAAGWRTNRQNSSGRSKESQEITYVPTSILKSGAVQQESTEIEVGHFLLSGEAGGGFK